MHGELLGGGDGGERGVWFVKAVNVDRECKGI